MDYILRSMHSVDGVDPDREWACADLTLARLEELRKAYKPTYYGGEDPADESRDW